MIGLNLESYLFNLKAFNEKEEKKMNESLI